MSTRVFTIAAGTPFVDALAAGILSRAGPEPLALAGATVLLPTRRACRSLREAFLRQTGGKPLLLPAMRPIGEVEGDELALAVADSDWEGAAEDVLAIPPAISPLRRRLLLAHLVLGLDKKRGTETAADKALFLAGELVRFLDQMQIEEVPFESLKDVVPAGLARHWQDTLEFLKILTQRWPAVLAEHGVLDPADRRRRLMDTQTEHWARNPPALPVFAAGTTGSVPATARLLQVVAQLPKGSVVLPGLDMAMDDAAWDVVDASHPQHTMKELLARLDLNRGDVAQWPAPGFEGLAADRGALLSAALRPAAAWGTGSMPEAAVVGLTKAVCAGPEEEARTIALALREALETPGPTAALVTPDRGLARRVAAELVQWGVIVDDSAGTPLALTRAGSFLRLSAEMLAEDVAPVELLSALKHPLAAAGVAAGLFRARVRGLERRVLRGPRPAPGFAGLRQAVADRFGDDDRDWTAEWAVETHAWLDPLAEAAAPFSAEIAKPSSSLSALLRAHLAFAEFLAADDAAPGAARLWSGDDGEAAAVWAEDVLRSAALSPAFEGRHYPAVLVELMAGAVSRPRWPRHPRVHIWGLLEARLQQADVMVLGGLNEGAWPPDAGGHSWLSRPMRQDVGLPPPERRIGLSAHDFVQCAAAPTVLLTRATKVEGQPAVPSRWIERLDAALAAAHLTLAPAPWAAWQAQLHQPEATAPLPPPAPRPPVNARPRRLAVTRVEALVRDPYAVYARYVLGLGKLDDLDENPGARERGRFVHEAVDAFLRAVEDPAAGDAMEQLLHAGGSVFGAALQRPGVRAFWWPRFQSMAAWFVAHERERRAIADLAGSEVEGETPLLAPAGEFVLRARADRIDRLHGGGLAVIDYKTGGTPQKGELESGFSPQLALEGVIAEAGGFKDIAAADVTELSFWKLHGRDDGGDVWFPSKIDVPALIEATRTGLLRLLAVYDDPATPYRSRPRPDYGPRFSDYDHLARVQEWSAGAGIEDNR